MKIGFAGLGHMGLPMAVNLMRAGYEVIGFDLLPEAGQKFVSAGGTLAESPTLLAATNICITMLQTGKQVIGACLGEQGIFTQETRPGLYIDCSTIDIKSSIALHEEANLRGILMVDAPVSGGVVGAQNATLTIMVGGSITAFETAEPVLSALGKTIIYTGAAGTGQAAKICNNMLLGISMIGVAEAFVLGQALGLDAHKLHEVLQLSSGQCWTVDKYVPVPDVLPGVPANNNYQPGFAVAMMLKDLLLAQQAAKNAGVATPMGQEAASLYQKFNDAGNAGLDFSAIIQLLE